ncbi:putative secreted protein (Por secretion system target) [Roseivirga pacifica]|uniref:Por secretion system C-terminal sorting domain-containing protein n=1 Tax=Roseivirga pacifica TaxID=1267423 RepID=A0A1I0RPJ2_9BACT|nr:C25 family cysteine peptidase [Roseivirga pacifica]RKQ49990.1 putative secreted protein (Por secretion system target) [Roseivirga pacifica]SEW43176.1 Por secretion system C-terminal sorting domain-containing protein [Roseivirga pacifica]
MNKLFAVLLGLILVTNLSAQKLGNEWIDYSLQYYKIKTGTDDFHKIGRDDLMAAGIDPATVNVANIQLFHRGEQVAIEEVGLADGSFDAEDYLLFYGRKNDGTQDTELYYRSQDQANTFYNLFSDTTAFFLTVANTPGLRIQNRNIATAGLQNTTVHREEILRVMTNQFSFGQYYPIGNVNAETKRSLYDRGQTFVGRHIIQSEYGIKNDVYYIDYLLEDIVLPVESYAKPELSVQIIGLNNVLHRTSVFVGTSLDTYTPFRENIELNYSNFGLVKQQIEWSSVEAGQLFVRVEEVGYNEIADSRVGVGYLRLTFPQEIDAQAQEKRINLYGAAADVQVTIENVVGDVALYDITDYRNPVRYAGVQNGNNYIAGVANDSEGRKLFLKQSDKVIGGVTLEAMNFQYEDLSDAEYLIVSHPFLRQAVENSYDDPVQAYIDYRASVNGGSFDVTYADAPDLYDEFGYGEFTPLAIRRFARKAYLDGDPQYLFIIGKSSRVDIRTQRQSDPLAGSGRELVPTMGAPGSDIMYTEGLTGETHVPAYPVGRLSVINAQSVANYLDKVKEKEATLKDSPWTKNVLQLSGGTSTDELVRFKNYIEGFEQIVSEDYLGAVVTNKSKRNNNAVQVINVAEEVNKGVGVVTFFGHSGSAFNDISIGAVTDPNLGYNNTGRYPLFIVNGCKGGEIFYYSSFGENWLAAKDLGAVNFLAHSDTGYPGPLREYTTHFYDLFADTLWMTKPIGVIQQEAIRRQLRGFSPDETDYAMVEETVLQGDPALSVFGHDKVDYIVRSEDIFRQSVNDEPIDASTPFFNLGIVINNAGRTSDLPVSVNVRRTLSDGSVVNLPELMVDPVRNRDTVYYAISNQGYDVFGENKFEVTLDIEGAVDEGSELNNTAEISFFFSNTGTFNTAPSHFATISETNATLVVQSADLKLNDKVFRVELDTSASFDSPWRQTTSLTGKGFASWDVELLDPIVNDTIQYYWRSVFEDDLVDDPVPWAESTFTYIQNGVEGWGQTAFDQFEQLNLSSVSKDEDTETWIFAGTETAIDVVTFGANHPLGGQPLQMTIDINGSSLFSAGANLSCAPNSINGIAFNKDSGVPYLILSTDGSIEVQDPLNCGVTPQVINRFTDSHLSDITVSESESLLHQYIDGVRDGDYVLFFSIGGLNYQSWRSDVINDFGRIGAATGRFGTYRSGEPLIIFGQKGFAEGTAEQIVGEPAGGEPDGSQAEINFSTSIFASVDSGYVESPTIGPVSQWGQLTQTIAQEPSEDQIVFDVKGVSQDGTETVLFAGVTMEQVDLSSVDPTAYPFIRLYVNMVDKVSASPGQLNRWLVSYQGVPEGVVSLQNDQAQEVQLLEGEPFEAEFKFRNISAYDFNGPLTVRYTFTNQDSREEVSSSIEIPAVASGQEVDFTLPIETVGKLGLNDLEVFVNPGDELEQYYSNNRIVLESFFNVNRDETSPSMDVTFDGVYIMDGDIVSSTPLVQVEMRDDNPYLQKTDTTGVELYLGQICDGCELTRVNFSDPAVTFVPATDEENFKVMYQPEKLEDGDYRLSVNATDASGNQAGVGPYEVTFEVIDASTITNFYPYPNPFSTSVRFVFTLTGNQIPDQLKIQIFTVSGKLVREITQAELGPIKIGNNITEYAWDGRDEFGDQLANGTYLYRVQIKGGDSDSFGHRNTSADKAFDKGFGKLVILR